MRRWQVEEDKFLQNNLTMTDDEIAQKLERTISSVQHRRWRLGLVKLKFWTQKEVETLVSVYYSLPRREILKRLRGRTWCAIVVKAEKLGLKRNFSEEMKRRWMNKDYRDSMLKQLPEKAWQSEEAQKRHAEKKRQLYRNKLNHPNFIKRSKELWNILPSRMVNEDLLFNFVLEHKEKFGYKKVLILRTKDFDFLGITYDGKVEKVELELGAKNFVEHHHDREVCDRVICAYGNPDDCPVLTTKINMKEYVKFVDNLIKLDSAILQTLNKRTLKRSLHGLERELHVSV